MDEFIIVCTYRDYLFSFTFRLLRSSSAEYGVMGQGPHSEGCIRSCEHLSTLECSSVSVTLSPREALGVSQSGFGSLISQLGS